MEAVAQRTDLFDSLQCTDAGLCDGLALVGIDKLDFIPRFGVDIFGLLISFTGLAMYSECAWCFHPHDALSSCLKSR